MNESDTWSSSLGESGIVNLSVSVIFFGLDKFSCLMYREYRGLLGVDPANTVRRQLR